MCLPKMFFGGTNMSNSVSNNCQCPGGWGKGAAARGRGTGKGKRGGGSGSRTAVALGPRTVDRPWAGTSRHSGRQQAAGR